MVVVSFNETVYIVNEGDTQVVCVDIVGDTILDDNLLLLLSVTATSGSASSKQHTISYINPLTCMGPTILNENDCCL